MSVFALRGDKFNANEFAAQALANGASYAVVDDANYVVSDRCILVEDTLATLQALAKYHRSQLKYRLLALRDRMENHQQGIGFGCAEQKFKTHATKGNLNNHIGVPLTVLSIDDSYEMAVIEMGPTM